MTQILTLGCLILISYIKIESILCQINKVRLRCVLGYVSAFHIIAKEYGRRKKEKDLIFVVGLVFYCYCTYNPANSVFSSPNKQVAKLHLVLDCKKYFYNKPLLKF